MALFTRHKWPLFQYRASFSQPKEFAGPQNQVVLGAVTRQELEAVAQSVAISYKCTQFERRSTRGQGQFQGGDFARF
jgi:hypothetical protein